MTKPRYTDYVVVHDLCIEGFLANKDPTTQDLGLALLDPKLIVMCFVYLRSQSDRNNWRLTTENIEVITEKTRDSIEKNVRAGVFQQSGAIRGLHPVDRAMPGNRFHESSPSLGPRF